MLEEILKVHQAGDLDGAESRYRQWLEANPDDPEALHLLAVLRRQRNDLAEALTLAHRATELAPNRANFHNTLGALLLQTRQFEAAHDSFTRTVRLDPNQFGATLGIAQIAALHGDVDGAEEALAKAERLVPDHPRLLAQKAGLAQLRRDHEAAIKLFMAAVKRDGNDPAIHANLGRSFAAVGHTAFAEQALRNALLLKPDYTAARITLGQVLITDNRPDEALQEYAQALAERPGHPMALAGRADALRHTGDVAGAIEAYRSAYAVAPVLQGLANSLAETLLITGAEEEARALLEDALKQSPRDADLRLTAVKLASRSGDDVYRQAVREWLTADPDSLAARLHLCTYLELRGEHDEADSVAREALALESRAAFARLLLARSALRNGQPEKAQEQLNLLQPSSLQPAVRAERSQLRGLARNALNDWRGAVDAWIDAHSQAIGEAALVLLPQAASELPTLIATEEGGGAAPAPVFLLGMPGAGAESLAALLPQFGMHVLADRLQAGGRADAISTGQFVELMKRGARDPSSVARFRDSYIQGLATIGESIRSDLIDWLPFADVRIIELLRTAFPSARFLVLQRDSRDSLLNWLALGCRQHLAASDPVAMGAWLARANEHLIEIRKRVNADQLLLINHAELHDAQALGQRAARFLGNEETSRRSTFNVLASRGGLPTSLPDGRWQAYKDTLSAAFAPLADSPGND